MSIQSAYPTDDNPADRLRIIVGPTAVGKSAVAERLAILLNADILVADSRQVYCGMDIGMDKPSPAAQQRVTRHLIDLVEPEVTFSAGAYQKAAEAKVTELREAGRPFIIEGGTGLYLRALLLGLWEGPTADWALRRQWQADEADDAGLLHRRLVAVDPESAQAIYPADLPKIIRALEVHHLTCRPLSDWHRAHRATRPRRPAQIIGLRRERGELYRRVEARIDQQLAAGLVEETRRFAHLPADLPSMRGLGYRQMLPYLRGERSFDESVAILKRDTRHYVKRQMTWFAADPTVLWLDLAEDEPVNTIVERVLARLSPSE